MSQFSCTDEYRLHGTLHFVVPSCNLVFSWSSVNFLLSCADSSGSSAKAVFFSWLYSTTSHPIWNRETTLHFPEQGGKRVEFWKAYVSGAGKASRAISPLGSCSAKHENWPHRCIILLPDFSFWSLYHFSVVSFYYPTLFFHKNALCIILVLYHFSV